MTWFLFLEEGATLFNDWVVQPLLDGIFSILDKVLTFMLWLVADPIEWFLGKACLTDLYVQTLEALTNNEKGLPMLVQTVGVAGSLLEWDWIMTVLSCGFSVTAGAIIVKVIVKLVPTIY